MGMGMRKCALIATINMGIFTIIFSGFGFGTALSRDHELDDGEDEDAAGAAKRMKHISWNAIRMDIDDDDWEYGVYFTLFGYCTYTAGEDDYEYGQCVDFHDDDWRDGFDDFCDDELYKDLGWGDEAEEAGEQACTCVNGADGMAACMGVGLGFALILLILVSVRTCCTDNFVLYVVNIIVALIGFLSAIIPPAWYAATCTFNSGGMSMILSGGQVGPDDDWESDDSQMGLGWAFAFAGGMFALFSFVAVCATKPPASSSAPPTMHHQSGVAMQPVAPFGIKFDPATGAPIPKFDPVTGEQNWAD